MSQRFPGLLGSTTSRFVTLIFLFQMLATGGVLYFVRTASEHALTREQQALVSELRDDLVAGYRTGGEVQLKKLIDERIGAQRYSAPVILLTRANGSVVAGNLAAWPTVIAPSTPWQELDLYRMQSNRPEHIGFMAATLPNGGHLLVGHVIDNSLILTRINEEAMFAALLVAVPLTFVIALMLGRIVGRSVHAIAAVAAAIDDGDFSKRVPLDGTGDSFEKLGKGVNALLDRIEALVSELRIVTDGLAHDLRSPITRLKSVLERAIIETNDAASLAALEKVSTEAEALLAMLSTALQISRAEAGIGRERFVPTDIRALVADLVEIYGPLAEEKGFALVADAPTVPPAPLHRELVSQALGNLIENALKYAHGGHKIIVSASVRPEGLQFVVADDGPGIPEGRYGEAQRRFGRLDPARHVSGSGLGLSLVQAVARLHDGTIALEDNGPGLRVVMTLASKSA